MSRKNKNLRAFLHQNPKPTIEQAWDAAWHGAQKTFHARSMQEMRGQVDRLREVLDEISRRVWSVVHPYPSEDAERYREEMELTEMASALLAELDNLEQKP